MSIILFLRLQAARRFPKILLLLVFHARLERELKSSLLLRVQKRKYDFFIREKIIGTIISNGTERY